MRPRRSADRRLVQRLGPVCEMPLKPAQAGSLFAYYRIGACYNPANLGKELHMQARPRLRPFSLGELLDESFRIYRREFIVLLAIAALVFVPYTFVEYLLQLPFQERILRLQEA